MLTHPQGQGFNSLENQKRVERRQARTEVAQELNPRLQDISQPWRRRFLMITECLPEREAVVRRVRLGHLREVAVGPVKGSTVHNGAACSGFVYGYATAHAYVAAG